jgi:endonuclease/exonuclease/phosphatase family metal-dependent hydrolase
LPLPGSSDGRPTRWLASRRGRGLAPAGAWAALLAAALGFFALGACSDESTTPGGPVPWDAGTGGELVGGSPSTGAGPVGGQGTGGHAGGHAAAGGFAGSGGSAAAGAGGNLGWPFSTELPEPCPPNPPDTSGEAWVGWANVQYPPILETPVGAATDPVYGRTYAEGQTSAPGAAPGWHAELLVGPYGTLPFGEGRCWWSVPATFNVDVGNDDEYAAQLTPERTGLFALLYRFRPPGGTWRYGDLDGSDNGTSTEQAGLLVVQGSSSSGPLVLATQNLRCRFDDWPARRSLVVAALARIAPDLVAFQEDCADAEGVAQSEEVRAELASYLGRGFEIVRVGTHLASDGGQEFSEGISVMSAHRIEASGSEELPHVHLPRRVLHVDVTIAAEPLRFYSTHFDYGSDATDARRDSAEQLLASWPTDRPAVLGGDLNAEPDEPGAATLASALADLWHAANPGNPGLTMPAADPARRIDYLFASPLLESAVRGAKLLDEHAGTLWLSDHRGVAAAMAAP